MNKKTKKQIKEEFDGSIISVIVYLVLTILGVFISDKIFGLDVNIRAY